MERRKSAGGYFVDAESKIRYGRTMAPNVTEEGLWGMKRTVVWLTESQIKMLGSISRKSLAPVSALVRQAVSDYLKKSRRTNAPKSS